jgi:hypothetical protein
MRRITKLSSIVLFTVLCAGLAFGQVSPMYPYIILAPAWPAAQKDSVTVQVVLGMADNSCLIPDSFANESFTVLPNPAASVPPAYTINVTYTTVSLPAKPCPMIYLPVVYGPVFKLGKLNAGSYTIMDGTTRAGAFNVSSVAFSNAGSTVHDNTTFTVATDKSVYYVSDSLSIHYTATNNGTSPDSFGLFGGNCEYDLILALKGGPELYRLSTNAMCEKNAVLLTLNPGATIAHEFPEFGYPAGVDGYVAALDSVVLTVSAQFWGAAYDSTRASVDITIKKNAAAVFQATVGQRPAPSCFVSHGNLFVKVPLSQSVTVRIFTPDGRLVPEALIRRVLAAGSTMIPLAARPGVPGISVVQVTGETFATTLKMLSETGR